MRAKKEKNEGGKEEKIRPEDQLSCKRSPDILA